jgi:hypothetical protein
MKTLNFKKTLKLLSSFISIIMISTVLLGCKNGKEEKINYIGADAKTVSKLVESYQLTSYQSNTSVKGIDMEFVELDGNIDLMSIYSAEEEEEVTIEFTSKFNEGQVRIILINSKGEVIDIVRNNGANSREVKLPRGKSVIKCIAEKATGNIAINVSVKENISLGEYRQDGVYLILNSRASGEDLSGHIYRIRVVNGQVDRVAKINLIGKIEDNKVVVPFLDDDWGNSGLVEIAFLDNNRRDLSITITNSAEEPRNWGIEAGEFTIEDKPLPPFLEGL